MIFRVTLGLLLAIVVCGNHDVRGQSSSDRDRERSRDDRSRKEGGANATPAVPGFGVESKVPKALGFDVPLGSPLASSLPPEQRYDRRVLEYTDRLLREYDRNGDDKLDKEEMGRARWSNDPLESDLNKDGMLSREELYERTHKRYAERSSSGSSSSSGSNNSSSASRSGSSSGSSSGDPKIRSYAESLLRQYDSNKNGVLEKSEFTQMKSSYHDADTNKDGTITLDELMVKLSGFAKNDTPSGSSNASSSSSNQSSSGGSSSSSSYRSTGSSSRDSRTGKSGEKKSYRPLTPTERLPKGLPDWFIRNDTDGDGQIAMSEYTATWTNAKAEEFATYDTNGDGVITPKECLAQPEKKK